MRPTYEYDDDGSLLGEVIFVVLFVASLWAGLSCFILIGQSLSN